MRGNPGDLERSRAGRRFLEVEPVADLGILRRADDEHARQQVRQHAERRLGVQRHVGVIDDFVVLHLGCIRPVCQRLRPVELRRLFVQVAIKVPDDVFGFKRGAVVVFHALPQGEDPAQVVAGIDLPFGGKARCQVGETVGMSEIPVHQGIVDRIADKTTALAAVVRDAAGGRQVGGGHANAQSLSRGLRFGRSDGGKREPGL